MGREERMYLLLLAAVLGCVCVDTPVAAAETGPPADKDPVVATVDGRPILKSEVDRLLAKVTGSKDVNPAALPLLRAALLGEIVDRRLVMAYARRTKSAAEPAQVDKALAELKAKLASQGRALEDYLKQQSIDRAELRRRIAWELTWKKYHDRHLTEQRLQAFFREHRREFDGTQISVSHILLRPEGDDPKEMDELIERAEAIRNQITAGPLTFAEAVRKHSAGPSAGSGGRLGPIARHAPMVEAFSRAAFQLEVGELSGPVRTRFGVHLIRCEGIRPGTKGLDEVRGQVEEALARQLLEELARRQERHTPVEYP